MSFVSIQEQLAIVYHASFSFLTLLNELQFILNQEDYEFFYALSPTNSGNFLGINNLQILKVKVQNNKNMDFWGFLRY